MRTQNLMPFEGDRARAKSYPSDNGTVNSFTTFYPM